MGDSRKNNDSLSHCGSDHDFLTALSNATLKLSGRYSEVSSIVKTS